MPLYLCISNIICSILFGRTYEKGDKRLKLMTDELNEWFAAYGTIKILLVNGFPWLRHVPLFGHFGMDELCKHDESIRTYIASELENVKMLEENANDDEEANDFATAYLKEIKRRRREGEDASSFNDWQLSVIIVDLWMAGMESTLTTLRWAFLAMIKYPRAQEKVHQEIDAVLGKDRIPSMDDRQSMPYVVATLHEVQRWANTAPIALPRLCNADFRLGGYLIPEGTHVISQISLLALDEKIFPRPQEFRPQRFLEDDGKTLRNTERIAPFLMGKRNCMGEGLARMELFLVFVHLMQNFRFSTAPNQDEPTAEPIVRFALAPCEHECLATFRNAA